MKVKSIILIVVGIFLGILLLQNTEMMRFQILFWYLEMPRILLLLFFFLFGLGTGLLIRFKVFSVKTKEQNRNES